MTDDYAHYDAAYLLGSLSARERAAYEEHLEDCPACRSAVDQLAGLPGLLATVSPEDALAIGRDDEGTPAPPQPDLPGTLLPRLLAEVERSRFRRRLVIGLAAAAAAVLVAAALTVGALRGGPSQPAAGHPTMQQMTPVVAGAPIHATARIAAMQWGTKVVIHCEYDGSGRYTSPLRYTMSVTDTSGHRHQIASWDAAPGRPVVVAGSTSLTPAEIASVEVQDAAHAPVLRLRL